MPRRIAILLLLSFLTVWTPTQAAEIRTLYQAEVVATGKDEVARDQDIRRGLQLVLGRVISPDALASRAAAGILDQSMDYVLAYEYVRKPAPDDASAKTGVLRISFDQTRLGQVLRKNGIRVWSEQRPEILVWLAVGDPQGHELFRPEVMPEIDRELRQAAAQWGLPVALPMLDLTDQQNLSVEDLWSGKEERIQAAASRYETAVVLAGQLARSAENIWEAQWRLYRPDAKPANWQGQFPSLAEAMQAGWGGTYGKLAEAYIPKTQKATQLELKVTGMSSLADVSRVANYLGSLSLVKTVEWLRVEPTQAVFKLVIRGNRSALQQAFALGKVLRPARVDDQGFSGMNYQLLQP